LWILGVIDAYSRELYGHIVAGSTDTGVAYIIPAYQVFEDINQRLGGKAELPAKDGSRLDSTIYMPLIYGEGRQKALSRLLKEIKDNNSINLPIAKGASFDSHTEEHNARYLRNTRVELLDQIMEWAKDRNSKSIFWLSGMAGTGKSTIACTVAQLLASNGQLGASFFFKTGEGERSNASRFFTTIVTDLTGNVPGLIPGISKAVNANPAIFHKALKDQLEKLLLQPLSQTAPFRALRFTIVIDALDECERDEDIRAILQLLSQTKGLKPVSLQIFVTSRPELPIRLGFKKMSDGTYEDLILHEVPRRTIEHEEAILNWLTPTDYTPQQNDFISRRQKGTGQWLLDSDEFLEWLNQNRQTMFCPGIPGIPGAGKTILASVVIDHLFNRYRSDHTIGITYIYFNFRRQHEQKPEDLLSSLLKQLLRDQASTPESMKTLYERLSYGPWLTTGSIAFMIGVFGS
jgi:NACHT domain